MQQLKLNEYFEKSHDICNIITKQNIGNIRAGGISLKGIFDKEILKFSLYLARFDGNLSDGEIQIIREFTDSTSTDTEIINKMEYDNEFDKKIPVCLKYTVLSDAGNKIKNNPYNNQMSMIFYDTFKMFGHTILAIRENDTSEDVIKAFDAYMKIMENFIKEYGVWYSGTQKLFTPEIVSSLSMESDHEKAEKLEVLLENLNSLTGLSSVKDQVNRLINLTKVQDMRKQKGMLCSDVSKHMVFSGNPGTGKTTVARMLAEIYKYMGVLKKGQLIEVDRSGLVKGYIGQTATRTQEVIEEALGGILFIDEAYALTVNKGEGDFGQEAVDTLLKAMEDYRDELIVIVAGYTDLMDEFLSSNPGLKSRFSNYIVFEDYTADEMFQILEGMLKKQQYKLSDNAKIKAKEILNNLVLNKSENFANARDVRNFMEKAISNHAMRVVNIAEADELVLSTIEAEDL